MAVKACSSPTPSLQQGERLSDQAVPPLPQLNLRGYTLPLWSSVSFLNQLSMTDVPTLLWLATLLRATYSPNGDFFTAAARAVATPGMQVTFVANSAAALPGYGTIRFPQFTLVAISGTTTLAQYLGQVFSGLLVYSNFPPISVPDKARVNAFALTQANALDAALAPSIPSSTPMFVLGHSLGGMIGEVLTYKWQRADRKDNLQCCTFGSPKPGDANFSFGFDLQDAFKRRFAAPNDLVPGFPPNLTGLNLVMPPPLRMVHNYWSQYAQPGQLYYIDSTGGIGAIDDPGWSNFVLPFITAAATGSALPITAQHTMKYHTTALRQAFVDWPSQLDTGWNSPQSIDTVNAAMDDAGL
jgi:hypothetical protein